MHKRLLPLLLLTMFAAGCAFAPDVRPTPAARTTPPGQSGISVVAEQAEYPAGTRHITLLWNNPTQEEYLYGDSFVLERREQGAWQPVPMIEGIGFDSIGYTVSPNSTRVQNIPLGDAFVDVPAGKYRVVVQALADQQQALDLFAEFSILEADAGDTPLRWEYLDEQGDTVATRFRTPEGFSRKEADGYGEFLRGQQLLPHGSPVLLYTGEPGYYQGGHEAVLAIDVGDRDLQQCADAALRLRCEYLFSIGDFDAIDYHLTNGFAFPYKEYRKGYRLQVNGNDTRLVKTAQPDKSYEAFRKYLDVLFNYASTRSLFLETSTIELQDMRIGDLFLVSGKPGHCLIVMDLCESEEGEKAILLAQSSMPAQQIHILRLPGQEQPWMYLSELWLPLQLGGWEYAKENIKRMP